MCETELGCEVCVCVCAAQAEKTESKRRTANARPNRISNQNECSHCVHETTKNARARLIYNRLFSLLGAALFPFVILRVRGRRGAAMGPFRCFPRRIVKSNFGRTGVLSQAPFRRRSCVFIVRVEGRTFIAFEADQSGKAKFKFDRTEFIASFYAYFARVN